MMKTNRDDDDDDDDDHHHQRGERVFFRAVV